MDLHVISSTPTPSRSRMEASSSLSSDDLCGLRPAAGSSRQSSRGVVHMARAISSRRCAPYGSSPAGRSARPGGRCAPASRAQSRSRQPRPGKLVAPIRPSTLQARRTHQPVVLCHQQIFECGHTGEKADVLEGARDAGLAGNLVAHHPLEQHRPIAGLHGEPADRRLVKAGDAIEDRGLAGAIRPYDCRDLARAGGKRYIVDRQQPAETHGEMLDLDQRRAHRAPPALGGWSRIDGRRCATIPRGRNTMISTMANPKASMR